MASFKCLRKVSNHKEVVHTCTVDITLKTAQMSSKKPGTGPVRKQKQRQQSHCSKCSNETLGVGSSSDYAKLPQDLVTVSKDQKTPSVFGNDTQKSVCVKNFSGATNTQNVAGHSVNGAAPVVSVPVLPQNESRGKSSPKQTGRTTKQNNKCLVVQDAGLDLFDVLDLLAKFIADQNYDPKYLNPIWTKKATGLLVSCGCGKFHYPFHNCKRRKDGYWDVESQVLKTYDRVFDELSGIVCPQKPQKRRAPPPPTLEVASAPKPTLVEKVNNSPNLSESGSECSSYTSGSYLVETSKGQMKRRKPVGRKQVRFQKEKFTKDVHQNRYVKKAPEWVQQELNIQKPEVVSAPVLDNHKPEKDLPELGMPTGDFNLVYTPPRWKFWHKQSWFQSQFGFNHDAHQLRKLAKSGKLESFVISDEHIIPSLYAYLMRNRNATYESFNIKLNHLHKLAQAWESAEMPKDWRKKVNSPSELNFYFNTIGKVANCSDPEILLSSQCEDRHPSLFKRLRRRLLGHKTKSA